MLEAARASVKVIIALSSEGREERGEESQKKEPRTPEMRLGRGRAHCPGRASIARDLLANGFGHPFEEGLQDTALQETGESSMRQGELSGAEDLEINGGLRERPKREKRDREAFAISVPAFVPGLDETFSLRVLPQQVQGHEYEHYV